MTSNLHPDRPEDAEPLVPDYAASQAMIPGPGSDANNANAPTWALVEIFGHRQHYGEIREVEAFGAKLLEVHDVDTAKIHRYGGASIFSMTLMSQSEMDQHIAAVKRARDRDAELERKYAERKSGVTTVTMASQTYRLVATENDNIDDEPF